MQLVVALCAILGFVRGANSPGAPSVTLSSLLKLGYSKELAESALASCSNDLDKAVEILKYSESQQAITEGTYSSEITTLLSTNAKYSRSDVVRGLGQVDGNVDSAKTLLDEELKDTPPPPPPAPPTPTSSTEVTTDPVIFEATPSTLFDLLVESPVPVIIDIYAPWCGPCKQLTPKLEEYVRQRGGKVRLLKIDGEQMRGVMEAIQGKHFPTILLFDKEIVFEGLEGFETKIADFENGKLAGTATDEFKAKTKGERASLLEWLQTLWLHQLQKLTFYYSTQFVWLARRRTRQDGIRCEPHLRETRAADNENVLPPRQARERDGDGDGDRNGERRGIGEGAESDSG